MKLHIFNIPSGRLPYDEIISSYNNFDFTRDNYMAEGVFDTRLTGNEKFATIRIGMQKGNQELLWEVPEEKIPVEFLDVILSTIKRITGLRNSPTFSFSIFDGSFHPVDSYAFCYEMATFLAIAKMIGFNHEKIDHYLKK